MTPTTQARIRRLPALAAAILFSLLHLGNPARAADKIYWSTFDGAIRVGNLDGSGTPETFHQESPAATNWKAGGEAIVINPATGKIYWALWSWSQIRVWNLDRSGTPETLFQEPGFIAPKGSGPVGLAIDPTGNKLYWTNWGWNYPAPNREWGQVRVGNLDGSGTPRTLYEDEWAGGGIGLDLAAGKLYWTRGGLLHKGKQGLDMTNLPPDGRGVELDPGAIRVGNIDGSGKARDLFSSEEAPNAMAIDTASNKAYWANWGNIATPDGAIRVGSLDGSGAPRTLFANEGRVMNVAIDTEAGKIYWPNAHTGAIRVGNLDGSGTAQNLGPNFAGEGSGLHWLAILRAPLAKGVPAIGVVGGSNVGSALSCSRGTWATDDIGGFLFRAPADYSCRVTASNHAGSNTQTSGETLIGAAK